MARRTWVALTALAVAVALGVLTGMVVRLGGRVKDGAAPQPQATFSATQTGFVPVEPSTPGPTMAPAMGTRIVSAAPTASDPAASSAGSTPAPVNDSTPPSPTGPTPGTSPSPTSSPTTISVQATTRTVPEVSSSSAPAVPEGPAAADGVCAEFGTRADPEGTATLYCQHDDHDGTLRWRAVVAGGACLSRTMAGVDDLGVQYRCRAAGAHANHWVRSR